ncbi:hypothetical protein Y032_0005g2641 [Ancylostoma ceylanicum]|nr:hypothetical protein Y032_0005g2641 [Ancylostoma ceylanicum]
MTTPTPQFQTRTGTKVPSYPFTMFLRLLVTATILFAYVSAFKLEDIPAQYRELMPERVKNFIAGLSEQEQATMEEIFENFHSYKNDQEVMAAFKAKSPGLAAKLEQFNSWFDQKAAALGPEARAYYNTLHEISQKIRAKFYGGQTPSNAEIKQAALEEITKYRALSAKAKAEFAKQFPILANLLTSDAVYKKIQALN